MVQRYKFESKSQHHSMTSRKATRCFQWFKGTNLKANHNKKKNARWRFTLFPMVQRYKFESKSQHVWIYKEKTCGCFQWFKGTNLKANHNARIACVNSAMAVSNGSKVQIWKQITTKQTTSWKQQRCFQWFKGTNLKANHNRIAAVNSAIVAVSNGSKVQIWKQITTLPWTVIPRICCFQWFKGTNLKANHNESGNSKFRAGAVPNSSKIEIQSKSQRQCKEPIENKCCFLCPKDRKIESKSQQPATTSPTSICCVQWL